MMKTIVVKNMKCHVKIIITLQKVNAANMVTTIIWTQISVKKYKLKIVFN